MNLGRKLFCLLNIYTRRIVWIFYILLLTVRVWRYFCYFRIFQKSNIGKIVQSVSCDTITLNLKIIKYVNFRNYFIIAEDRSTSHDFTQMKMIHLLLSSLSLNRIITNSFTNKSTIFHIVKIANSKSGCSSIYNFKRIFVL